MNKLLPILGWLALPVYLWQGFGVRRKAPRLAPPPGDHMGAVKGKGAEIRLLVIGDSSAASVGVDDVADGIAANLANVINERTGRPVKWRAAGANSATMAQIRDFTLPHVEKRDWTHVVVTAGTNDVKNLHTVRAFKRDFGTLLYALRARFPRGSIFWSPPVDMRDVPALPFILARLMEIRAVALNDMGQRLCRERFAVALPRLPIADPSGFCVDGFHASPAGYRAWAEHVAGHITGEEA